MSQFKKGQFVKLIRDDKKSHDTQYALNHHRLSVGKVYEVLESGYRHYGGVIDYDFIQVRDNFGNGWWISRGCFEIKDFKQRNLPDWW